EELILYDAVLQKRPLVIDGRLRIVAGRLRLAVVGRRRFAAVAVHLLAALVPVVTLGATDVDPRLHRRDLTDVWPPHREFFSGEQVDRLGDRRIAGDSQAAHLAVILL